MSTNLQQQVFGVSAEDVEQFDPANFPVDVIGKHYLDAGVPEPVWSQFDHRYLQLIQTMLYRKLGYYNLLTLVTPAHPSMSEGSSEKLPTPIRREWYTTKGMACRFVITKGEAWWPGEKMFLVHDKETLHLASVYLATLHTNDLSLLDHLPKAKRPVGRPADPSNVARNERYEEFKRTWGVYIELCKQRKQRKAEMEQEYKDKREALKVEWEAKLAEFDAAAPVMPRKPS